MLDFGHADQRKRLVATPSGPIAKTIVEAIDCAD